MENSKSIPFYLIAARCEGNGIGKDNDLPWSLKSEMDYFTRMTTTTMDPSKQNALIMGRRTWESIPVSERPLPGRTSIVLTSRPKEDISPLDEVLVCRSFDEAVQRVEGLTERIETCWVIGGSPVYRAAMEHRKLEKLYVTRIFKHFDCDTFFPTISEDDWELTEDVNVPSEIQIENGTEYKFEVYRRRSGPQ